MASSGLKTQKISSFSLFFPQIFQPRFGNCIVSFYLFKNNFLTLFLIFLRMFISYFPIISSLLGFETPPCPPALNANFINALFIFLPDQLTRVINEIGHNTSPCGTPVATSPKLKQCHLSLPFANVLSANL